MEEVYVVKMAKFRHDLHSQNDKVMPTIKVNVSEKTLARIRAGVRVKGTLGMNQITGVKDFNAWQNRTLDPNYVPQSRVMYETTDGVLRETKHVYSIYVKVKRSLGKIRSAWEMKRQAEVLTENLKSVKTIDEIMNEV